MDDDFTHSNMEVLLIHNNNNMINPAANSLKNNFSSGHEEFTPNLPANNFAIHHHHHESESCGLPFIPLPAHDTNNNPSFDFSSDHQAAASFNDPITHLADDHMMIKRTSTRDEISLGMNSNPPILSRERIIRLTETMRKKNSEAELEKKPREVVHVRARRGEATDSHSLAERLRREKINGKLRNLQELVPGCYKTMGMSVMLDITINYIRSLQNQIEFLSMKLSAASMFYDFNSAEMDALDTLRGANGYEAQVMGGEGYGDLLQFQSTWPL